MALDEATSTIVLAGGYGGYPGGGDFIADTWTWNGVAWTRHSPTSQPNSARGAMAYDPVNRKVLLFNEAGETWLWDGVARQWSKLSLAVQPPKWLAWAAMATDDATRTIVLFGGGFWSPSDETWIWDGATMTWTKAEPTLRPPGGRGPAMARDPRTRLLVLFAGGNGAVGETWLWNGRDRSWRRAATPMAPTPRRQPALATDVAGGRIVLFGGGGPTIFDFRADTWIWDGRAEAWIPQGAAGPEMRYGASTAYDPVRRAPFMFGGLGQVKPCVNTSGTVPRDCGGLYYVPNQWLDDSWHYVRKP